MTIEELDREVFSHPLSNFSSLRIVCGEEDRGKNAYLFFMLTSESLQFPFFKDTYLSRNGSNIQDIIWAAITRPFR